MKTFTDYENCNDAKELEQGKINVIFNSLMHNLPKWTDTLRILQQMPQDFLKSAVPSLGILH